jgi:hypothetical protein
MIDDRKLLFTATALALAGTLGLLAYSLTIVPQSLGIGDIGAGQEGAIVITSGTVTGARTLSDGGISLVISDMETSASITAYVPPGVAETLNGASFVPGAVLRVTGQVSSYEGDLELSVGEPADISVLAEAGTTAYELGTILRSVELFDGLEVTTSGQILDMDVIQANGTVFGTSFTLRQPAGNQTYSIECFCADRDLTVQHDDWDAVSVTGEVSYYESRGCWQIVVDVVSPALAAFAR